MNKEEIEKAFVEAKKELEMPREELLNKLWDTQQENQKYKEIVDKAIYHLDFFISDTNLSKYDTLKILMHAKKILKGVDKEVE